MRKLGNRLIYSEKELRVHLIEYVAELESQGLNDSQIDARIGEYYTNRLVKKYSKDDQDKMWEELYHTIMEVPGGYWQIVDNMDYLPEFEHYRFKKQKSQFGQK